MLTTPGGVWHRDSHYWRKFIGRGAQHTDLNKGLIKIIFAKIFGKDFWGGQGHCDPQMFLLVPRAPGYVYAPVCTYILSGIIITVVAP